MKLLVCSLILALSTAADAALNSIQSTDQPAGPPAFQAEVGVSSKFIYNVFYDANRAVNDTANDVTPELHIKPKGRNITFQGDAKALIEQYVVNSVQNHVDYDGKAQVSVNEDGPTSGYILGEYYSFSDPSPTETFGRIPRNVMSGEAGIKVKGTKSGTIDVKARYLAESFTLPKVADLGATHLYDNNLIEGIVEYKNQFLPETSWFVRGSGGQKVFPSKPAFDPSTFFVYKNDSVYGLAEAGFIGRLSDRSTVDFALGWLYRNYAVQTPDPFASFDTFFAPVFYMRFAEQVTRREQFTLGYNYKVEDSYYTNYYLDQEIYVGLVKVLGDQVLMIARIGYDYRSYSLPFRRDDLRITTSLSMRYSLSKIFKLTADLKVDVLNCDGYDNTPIPISPDRPLNYKSGSIALGLLATF